VEVTFQPQSCHRESEKENCPIEPKKNWGLSQNLLGHRPGMIQRKSHFLSVWGLLEVGMRNLKRQFHGKCQKMTILSGAEIEHLQTGL
jgi:hypothetical protein